MRGKVAEQVVQVIDVLLDGLLSVGGRVLLLGRGGAGVLRGVPLAGGEGRRGLGHRPHLGDAGQVGYEAIRASSHTVVLVFAF